MGLPRITIGGTEGITTIRVLVPAVRLRPTIGKIGPELETGLKGTTIATIIGHRTHATKRTTRRKTGRRGLQGHHEALRCGDVSLPPQQDRVTTRHNNHEQHNHQGDNSDPIPLQQRTAIHGRRW